MPTKSWWEDLKGRKRPRHRQDDNIKMDLRVSNRMTRCDWIHVAKVRSRCLGSCEHTIKISGSLKGGEFIDQLSEY
jgi:hypothetical protein